MNKKLSPGLGLSWSRLVFQEVGWFLVKSICFHVKPVAKLLRTCEPHFPIGTRRTKPPSQRWAPNKEQSSSSRHNSGHITGPPSEFPSSVLTPGSSQDWLHFRASPKHEKSWGVPRSLVKHKPDSTWMPLGVKLNWKQSQASGWVKIRHLQPRLQFWNLLETDDIAEGIEKVGHDLEILGQDIRRDVG